MAGQFSAHIWTSIWAGVIVGFPYILYELWRFISPGLYEKERRYSRGFILIAASSTISIIIALIYSLGNLDMSSLQRQLAANVIDWLAPFMGFLVISIAFVSFFGILLRGLQRNILANEKYQKDLEYSRAELQNTVSLLDTVIESFPEVFYMYDFPPKQLIKYNNNYWKLTGYTESEIKTMTIFDWLADDVSRSKMDNFLKLINNNESVSIELPSKTKDGSIHPILYSAKSFTRQKKDYIVGFAMNLTDFKELESKFRQVFEGSNAGIILADKEGNIKEYNNFILKIAEVERENLIDRNIFDFYPESDKERRIQLNSDLFEGKIGSIHEEREIVLANRSRKYLDVSVGFIPNTQEGPLAVYILVDITRQKNYQYQLEKSLKEKELLLEEVQHRVRNNLQLISSLINISSEYSENIEKSKQAVSLRIQAMSLIHEKLSEEDGYASVDLESYLSDLIGTIYELYKININKIQIAIEVPGHPVIKIDIATSLGIIINEIMSNSILHAFPEIEGRIMVSVQNGSDSLHLRISDDGIGLPDDYNDKSSFGFQIIDSLVKQIKGELVIRSGFLDNNRGSEFILKIPNER